MVAVAGVVLAWFLVARGDFAIDSDDVPTLVLLAFLVLLAECYPVRVARSAQAGLVTVSMPFLLPIVLLFGLGPAVVCLAVSSVLSDLLHRKGGLKTAFNAGQYVVSLAAVEAVLSSAESVWFLQPVPGASEFLLVVLVGSVFLAVNYLLTIGVVILARHADLTTVARGFGADALVSLVLVLVSPVAFVIAEHAPLMLPALLLPAAVVHRSATLSMLREHEALHDGLTGLPNREFLREAVERRLRNPRRSTQRMAVMLIDLDHFKEVNDTLGHGIGDELLRHVGAQLTGSVSEDGFVARLGGDEFAVMEPVGGEDGARAAARALRESISTPFVVSGLSVDIDASIGVALWPQHGDDVDALLRRADVAMYQAKDERVGVAVYEPSRDRYSRRRLRLLGQFRQAIEDEQFVLYYQPKVALGSGRVTGVEALVRWAHPEHGLLSPAQFIPLVERTAHIDSLTWYVLAAAIEQGREWGELGLDLSVAVNLPPHSLHDPAFVGKVAELLRVRTCPTRILELEITESTIMRDQRRAAEALGLLSSMGVSLAIDDFGVGYSSLAYLQQLPVHKLKIDRSFVSALPTNPDHQAIVRSMIDLAHNLDMTAVAEGVEDDETLRLVRQLNCDEIQGFLVSAPMPADVTTAWLGSLGPGLEVTGAHRTALVAVGGVDGRSA
jgi:diguanylate cyclase (GGDEF)-like protein